MGWIGTWSELSNCLSVFGAEKDENGAFLVRGDISSYMGFGDEYVVGENAVCMIGGRETRIVPLLASTSHGVQVQVF